jgi:hypothetical protein
MKKLMAITVLVLLLSACGNNTNKHVQPDISSAMKQSPPFFTLQAPLAENMPNFHFDVFESEYDGNGDEYYQYTYTINISCDELPDYTPQTIIIHSNLKWEKERDDPGIDVVDIDFDGLADIQAVINEGTINRERVYYRWNPSFGDTSGGFETEPFFEMDGYSYKLFPETKQIICYARDSALDHPRLMYQLEYQNGTWKYQLLRCDKQEFEDEESEERDIIIVRAFLGEFEGKEIYRKYVPEKKFDFERDCVSDDFLRFGVENPISIEKAETLIYKKYGKVSPDTGFALSYVFEGMIVHKELSCYKFRSRWFVDGDHWSTIGFVVVTPNGNIFDIN